MIDVSKIRVGDDVSYTELERVLLKAHSHSLGVTSFITELEKLGFAIVPITATDSMAHAMSRLDGWDRDRDMPTLQYWKDYWDAALIELRGEAP